MLPIALLLLQAASTAVWRPPAAPHVRIARGPEETWKVTTTDQPEFTLESEQSYPVRSGEYFEINVRIRVDLHTRALPELVSYDAAGRELQSPSALAAASSTTTTNWQAFHRILAPQPGAAQVRARIRGDGHGEILIAGLEFRPRKIDPYETGALVSQIHPKNRRGLVIESNLNIANPEMVSKEDRDGDGKWALILVDLDRLSEPEQKGVDWRTKFEYRPNEIYWSDGAVLKSDSVLADREPDANRALHFRTRLHAGAYQVILNDPGRAIAVSRDGKTWKRYKGGEEAGLGRFDAPSGEIEFWLDACYRDPVSAGPAYFDYIRVFPADDSAAADRLFRAARQNPPPSPRGSAQEWRVDVTAHAPVNPAGRSWPVRCGLPIPRGELGSAANAAVLDHAGKRLPSEARAMGVWPDGTVKWLYLDFMSDFSQQSEQRFTIIYGNKIEAVPPGHRVKIQRMARGIEVDTGAVRFLVPSAHFGMVEDVRAGGKQTQAGPISAVIAEAGGKIWRATDLPVTKLQIEQPGPLHCVILAETAMAPSGRHADGFAHRARIHAYAGSPLVEVDYFVANTDARPKVMVRSIDLSLAPQSPVETSGTILAKTGKEPVNGAADVRLRDGSRLGLGVADFRETYPKAIRWGQQGVEIALWAAEGGGYEWIQGVGKTHHIALDYGDSAGELMAAGPILATAAPEWYVRSGAFGPIGTAAASSFPAIEHTFSAHMRGSIVGKVGLGFENYGDHSSGGYVAGTFLWDNNEYDVPAAAMVHFARTGDRSALALGIASAQHYVDVDTIHYNSKKADWAEAPHTHSHGDVGHHTADGPGMHHAGYVQGLILASYFTGDPFGIAGARGVAEWVLRNISPENNVGQMERALGHPLMTLTDVYEATWDDRYLRGAARLVDWAEKWEHPIHSGFLAPITEQPAFYSGSTFNGGLITSALLKFNGWAKLPEIDAMEERVARWLLTEMWKPAGIMSKGGSPRRTASPGHISSHMRALRDVYLKTHDPLFMAVPRELMIAGFAEKEKDIPTRDTGLVFNYLPWFMRMLEDEGNPAPDPQFRITAKSAMPKACFAMSNTGTSPITDVRATFQARLDFKWQNAAVPSTLAPGQTVELCYPIEAPRAINLTSQYNALSYAHCTASARRSGKPILGHAWVKIELK
jgi:YetA-like protein